MGIPKRANYCTTHESVKGWTPYAPKHRGLRPRLFILTASVGGSGNSSKLRGQRNQNQGALQKRERANIMITAAVVVIAVIIFLYITDRLPGI